MPDRVDEDDDSEGTAGQGVIALLPSAFDFAPHLRYKVRFVGDKRFRALFKDRRTAEAFAEKSETGDASGFDASSTAAEMGGLSLILLRSLGHGIKIWMRLPDGMFLVLQNGRWQPPEHQILDAATDAAVALIGRYVP